MKVYILLFVLLTGGFLSYAINAMIRKSHRKQHIVAPLFEVDIDSDPNVNAYIARMPQQYKDNSRVLKGSGKMHFAEAIVEGSEFVRSEKISVLNSIGEKFS